MDYDKLISKIFFKNNTYSKSVSAKFNKNKCKYRNLLSYIINRYNDSDSIRETIYRIYYNIEEKPKCPITNIPLKFYGRKNKLFLDHSDNHSKRKDINVQSKTNETSLIKYGEHNLTNREKYKKTCLEKYGVDNIFKTEKVKQIKRSVNIDKIIETCRIKYNADYFTQTEAYKEKNKKTCLEKYGVDNFSKSKEFKDRVDYINIAKKVNITKHKNNTFNKSKLEEECYTILCKKFSDVIRQYRSEVYPFNCDFYIPSLDLYIEYNGSWTHGKHAFDSNNKEDNNTLNKWIERSVTSKFYINAINTWTKRDVLKRNTAKENNLNYIEFWTIDDVKKWILSD